MLNTVETYTVLINAEKQYSVWSAAKAIPQGWSQIDIQGSLEECNAYINEHWKDMRPESLRQAMANS
ncbi:MbtH family protein [Pseudoalteromonas piscicida]|uniref:MbtH family protein n=1 Tax=Pseudoalteromonas piscicida TaxID=43662 RepID=A0AAD0W6L2_PSEO7|nr:MbtH family NRPS accessory protein [Pseudoalteromonas piscicida]ASD69789.1 MbtH family protein [Pseudoalteromonas piscicida]AXR00413.1 MbtH family protein [Pseudoalteromonas piscicida]AXR04716.1 MbtH family protein [Pseudoalteromonas piscicida]